MIRITDTEVTEANIYKHVIFKDDIDDRYDTPTSPVQPRGALSAIYSRSTLNFKSCDTSNISVEFDRFKNL